MIAIQKIKLKSMMTLKIPKNDYKSHPTLINY